MATPLSAARLLAALRAEGLRVVEHGSWRTHNRNHKGPWGPVHGVMVHHTATSGTDASVRICRYGYTGLPGPLCHGVIPKDGSVHLVGYGRANHAGLGDDEVLAAVKAERDLPVDNEAVIDGNRHFYGFECVNLGNGRDPWPIEQLDGMARACAAICRAHGWSAQSVIGHKEWQPGKPDPAGIDMDHFRARVQAILDDEPTPKPPAPVAGTTGGKVARYQVTINGLRYGYGAYGDHVTAVGKALVAKGHGAAYKVGPGPRWTDADTINYASWQRSLGYKGADADGVPGPTSLRKLLGKLPSKPGAKPRYQPYPGAAWFYRRPKSPIITAMGKRLVAEGCGRYQVGPGPQWTEADRASYAAWQRKLGYRGRDADGWPGKTSWDRLKVPYTGTP